MKKHGDWMKETVCAGHFLFLLISFLLIGADMEASYSLRLVRTDYPTVLSFQCVRIGVG